jgi:RNA polymerase sigma factor (sigma-70 family)
MPPVHVQAMEAAYACHAPGLRRRCLQLTTNADAADELMQEVFVRFIERFPRPPAEMNVGAYLKAMARNVLWNQLRDDHEVPDGDLESSARADEDLEHDPERSALLGEQQSRVRRCAALLTGRQRRALTLRDVEGYSYAEIGSELGIATDAVAQVISRARIRLRGALRRAEIDIDDMPASCRDMLRPLSDYLDGKAALHAPEIEGHLADCASCRQTLALFEEAGSRLRGIAPFVAFAGLITRFRRGGGGASPGPDASVSVRGTGLLARVAGAVEASGAAPAQVGRVAAVAGVAALALVGGGVAVHTVASSGSGAALAATTSAPHARPHVVTGAPAAAGPATTVGHAPAAALAVNALFAVRRTHVLRIPSAPSVAGTAVPIRAGTTPAPTSVALPAPGGRTTSPSAVAPAATPGAAPPPPAATVPVQAPKVVVPPDVLPVTSTPVTTLPVVTAPTPPTVTVPVPPIVAPSLDLGLSSSFAVLAGSGVTNTGLTSVSGDLGTFPTPAITGLASLSLTGSNQAGGATSQQAKTDLDAAYASLAARPSTGTITGDLGGRTLTPGVYDAASSIGLTGTLTLDGQGDPNAVFVLRAGSTLTTASASQVVLAGGARSCNVFWQVGSSATLGTGSILRGSILAAISITVTTGVTIDGRVLARTGAITLDSDSITRSGPC